jgi:hypothetical protein
MLLGALFTSESEPCLITQNFEGTAGRFVSLRVAFLTIVETRTAAFSVMTAACERHQQQVISGWSLMIKHVTFVNRERSDQERRRVAGGLHNPN